MTRVESIKARAGRIVEYWRIRRPWVDHLIRTVQRYQLRFGDRLAGAVTYFAFLSFFPLIALAYAIFGYVLSEDQNVIYALETAIKEQLPGLSNQLDLKSIANAKATAGIIGLLGLLYAGLGAVDALRGALRDMYMTTAPPPNFFIGKLRDLLTLLMLGFTLIVSVLVGGFATQATTAVAEFLGLGSAPVTTGTLWLVGVAAGVGADWVLFLIVLGFVAKSDQPFKVLAMGALLGAIGFAVLKQVASLLLAQTLSNPIYGTFAVMVGLLIWINFSARLVMYVAAWTATAGLHPPPSPSPIPSNGS
ncbi:YihY/virulence factor BrkB family protein [Nonomuraea rhizosphaerae]|uniref:YihY/virulence factor BrkB family protein n=1 Tax=Nonomuraea rhizosphaerae TaxID=2665663 RepID=UPI001FE9267D|nr:YihY/virulence factor BrkB family protein [Nonomuraea rhizosphaerae]